MPVGWRGRKLTQWSQARESFLAVSSSLQCFPCSTDGSEWDGKQAESSVSPSQPFPSLASTGSVPFRRQTPAGALTPPPQQGVEGSLTHPQQENLRLAHVNRAGPRTPDM